MAEAGAPAPSPFPPGDPRSAQYNETLAALQHQQETSLAEDKGQREEAQSAYKYGISQYNAAEPKALTAEQNQANSQGLLESGINAQRRGGILADYVGKRGQLSIKEQQAEDRIARAEQKAREDYASGVHKAGIEAQERYKTEQEKLAPNEPEPAKAAPAGPGLVVVSQKAQPNSRSVRRAAAKKVVHPRQRGRSRAGGTQAP